MSTILCALPGCNTEMLVGFGEKAFKFCPECRTNSDKSEKRCTTCFALVPREDFPPDRSTYDGIASRCRECISYGNHGLTKQQVYEMLTYQDGLCKLCLLPLGIRGTKSTSPCIDHDHKCCPGQWSCGKCIRGIIHKKCNQRLESVEDKKFLQQALAYLQFYDKEDRVDA